MTLLIESIHLAFSAGLTDTIPPLLANSRFDEAWERLLHLGERLEGYWRNERAQVLVELALIWIVVYLIMRFLRGTRGARIVKAVLLILGIGTLLVQFLAQDNQFSRLGYLYSNFLAFAALVMAIVFQPELRRALVRLGEARIFKQSGIRKARVVEEVLGAVEYMSRNKIGALIAIERQVGMRGIVEQGTQVDGDVTRELLQTIFWPGSALHDMGVVIRGDRIVAAGVQFPLADGENIPQELGSRHRAAIGLSQESDALILAVSEETGTISVAERGEIRRGLSVDDLRPVLTKGIATVGLAEKDAAPEGFDGGADASATAGASKG